MVPRADTAAYDDLDEVIQEMFNQVILPLLLVLLGLGLLLAAVLWGDDSALAAGAARDGRAVRWALRPEKR